MAVINGQCKVFLSLLIEFMLATRTLQSNLTEKSAQLQDSEECGVSSALLVRVVGGTDSLPHSWPWMAAIFVISENSTEKALECGGAIISHKHILTAAHCSFVGGLRIPAKNLEVHLGDHNVMLEKRSAGVADFSISYVYLHDNYVSGQNYFDIAILKVNGWITYSQAIKPICLPTSAMVSESFEDRHPYIAGWGRLSYRGAQSDVLRHVQIETVPNEVCGLIYASMIKLNVNHLCAGYRLGGKDACQGDSGGSLMLPIENKWYTIGVVSVGIKCGEPGYPGIFTRVTSYIDWIEEIMKF